MVTNDTIYVPFVTTTLKHNRPGLINHHRNNVQFLFSCEILDFSKYENKILWFVRNISY